jgi:fructokinase
LALSDASELAPGRIGIDLGGTKIEGLLIGPDGRELARQRIKTPRHDYDGTLRELRALVEHLEQQAGISATVGLGMPGSISPKSGLGQNANSTWLNGKPFAKDFAAAMNRPVRVANDANCFALSEAVDGAGKDVRSVFGVILGTGTGGGLVVDGHIVDGPNGTGGEWGHMPLPWAEADEYPGPTCFCGRRGCMETWVAGPSLEADYARATGAARPATEIAALARDGDAPAAAALRRHASRLARGLAVIVNITDPAIIVLGGGLSRLTHLYDEVPPLMERWILSDRPSVTIVPPVWGDAGGVRGAAWLWSEASAGGTHADPPGAAAA